LDAQNRGQLSDVRGRERLGELQHGPPPLQPVRGHLFQALHVEHAVAELDGGIGLTGQHVGLGALARAPHPERLQRLVGRPATLAEGPPLPAWDDLLRHVPACARRSAKNSSALRVFVSCSPERSTPRLTRKARATAATSNISLVSQRVESSRMREPSGYI